MLQLFEQNGWIDNFRRLEGKSAPRKGPLYTDSDVYKWMEAVAWQLASGDVPELHADFDRPDLLGGLIVLLHAGTETDAPLKGASLYRTFPAPPTPKRPVDLTLIPYYAWANRGPGNMEVWIPISGYNRVPLSQICI